MTTITYERIPVTVTRYDGFKLVPVRTVYNYKVIIDGEWRATFSNNATGHRIGFSLSDRTGKALDWEYRQRFSSDPITRAEFDRVIEKVLPKIATIERIERHIMMKAADADNREFDAAREARRISIHRQMLSEALSQYIENANDPQDMTNDEADKVAAAQALLDQTNARIAETAERN